MTAPAQNWQPEVIIRPNNARDEECHSGDGERPCWKRALLWYIAPLSFEIKYAAKDILYHFVNLVFAWACFGYCVGAYTAAGVCVMFIFGIPLLWIVLEISILIARLDILLAYYLVERKLQQPVKLALQVRHLPPCICQDPLGSFWSRFKFIVTSCPTYLMIIYQMVVKVTVAMIFSWSMLPIVILLCGMGLPFWYASDSHFFHQYQICLFGESGPHKDVAACHWYQFPMKDFGDAFGVFLLCLAFLPLALRINSYFADLLKIVTYYFLTDHFAAEQDKTDQASLIPRETASEKSGKAHESVNFPAIDDGL